MPPRYRASRARRSTHTRSVSGFCAVLGLCCADRATSDPSPFKTKGFQVFTRRREAIFRPCLVFLWSTQLIQIRTEVFPPNHGYLALLHFIRQVNTTKTAVFFL